MQTQNLNIDLFVGKKIRLKRKMLGMSQKTLGDALGVSFQ
ncbi:transcriptional regulator [Bartonella tribocorum]